MNLTIVLLLLTLVLYLCLSCVYSYLPSPAQCGKGRWLIPGYPAQINASRRRGTIKPDPSYNEENMILIYFGHKRCQRSSLIYFVIPAMLPLVSFPTAGGFTNQLLLSGNCETTANLCFCSTCVSLLVDPATARNIKAYPPLDQLKHPIKIKIRNKILGAVI